jgi:hypothetical protein
MSVLNRYVCSIVPNLFLIILLFCLHCISDLAIMYALDYYVWTWLLNLHLAFMFAPDNFLYTWILFLTIISASDNQVCTWVVCLHLVIVSTPHHHICLWILSLHWNIISVPDNILCPPDCYSMFASGYTSASVYSIMYAPCCYFYYFMSEPDYYALGIMAAPYHYVCT